MYQVNFRHFNLQLLHCYDDKGNKGELMINILIELECFGFIFHRERFIVTWLATSLYIIDPVLGHLVAWYSLNTGDIKLTTDTLSLLL